MTAEEFARQWFDSNDYVQAHTSGSTGTPKEIRLLKADMEASARVTNEFFGIRKDHLLVCPLSADYIAGKMMMVRGFVSGAHVVMIPPSNAPQWHGSAHLVAVVPSQVPHILSSELRYRHLLVGGAPLPESVLETIVHAGASVYESYGMTETCSHVALKKVGHQYFTAMPGVSFSTDARGCLKLSLDNFSFRELTTNDIVDLHNATHFKWLGRFDNVINSGGIKVQPEILEKIISEIFTGMGYYYISSKADEKWGRAVVLVVEDGYEVPPLDVLRKKMVAAGVDVRKCPREIIHLPQLKRTSSGKIKRETF